ncbi:unnamed protein product [Oikopleura dioica]|uniref:Peptidase M14 domain-containing protein n=1 Tax=Oikopleura dioica TaxID=34765 RepID=E4XC17_OIKDI|nr:unnamed protein product [Oikopleura dioica]CBY40004.1 unnamed protein product [Oikopleura dioica]
MGDAILRTHGKTYEVGQSRDVVGYAAGGTTEDYAYHPDNGLDIPYAWVYELRDDGKYGFLLGPDEIIPTAEEVVASFIELRNHLFSQ